MHVLLHKGRSLPAQMPRLTAFVAQHAPLPLSFHPAWLLVLRDGLQHTPCCLEAVDATGTRGLLLLCLVQSAFFGRYLVSLPYLNYGGVFPPDTPAAAALVEAAVREAARLQVKFLELRQCHALNHPALAATVRSKVHMRLPLPTSGEALWKGLDPKVRNQVRKGQKQNFAVAWGGMELLADFYAVFSRNMRDLGTPVFGRGLFQAILRHFPQEAELCVLRDGNKPIAAALLLHGWGITEVPSASALKEYNAACANMLMYWHLLERSVQRHQTVFDFGRSTFDGNTYRFKKQWGAEPLPATWQYHLRTGQVGEMRPDNPKYGRLIRLWKKLPLALTERLGPLIVRGIP